MFQSKKFGLTQNRLISILRRIPLFEGLSDLEYKHLIAACQISSVPAGDYLFRQGDFGYELFVLLSGEIDVILDSAGVISTLRPGEVLGEMAVVRKSQRSASAIAKRDALLFRMRRDDLDGLLHRAPRCCFVIMNNIARTLSERILLANLPNAKMLLQQQNSDKDMPNFSDSWNERYKTRHSNIQLPKDRLVSILRRIPLFDGLLDKEYAALVELCHVNSLAQGNYLFKEGDIGQELYLLLSGEIRIFNETIGTIDTITPGEVLGEMAVVRKSKRTASAGAEKNSLLFRLQRDELDQLMLRMPRVSYVVMTNISRALSERLVVANLNYEHPKKEHNKQAKDDDYAPISVR